VTITPSTDMLMQFGTFPATGPALSRGIVSGFGIDTICSAGNDLFSEMRLALAAERSPANAPALASGKQVPAVDLHQRDMLRLATIDGARVWHLEDEIGTLTPGKQADIAVIDMRSPHLDGFGDPVAVMVHGAGPADVETVIVGGDVVKCDGKLAGDSVGHALELMHAAREHLRALPDPGRKQASQTSDGPLRRPHAMNEEHTRATGGIKCRPIPRPPGPG
jgi:5-methylthioadenosine/S-adenosylhomocysteine deaminase